VHGRRPPMLSVTPGERGRRAPRLVLQRRPSGARPRPLHLLRTRSRQRAGWPLIPAAGTEAMDHWPTDVKAVCWPPERRPSNAGRHSMRAPESGAHPVYKAALADGASRQRPSRGHSAARPARGPRERIHRAAPQSAGRPLPRVDNATPATSVRAACCGADDERMSLWGRRLPSRLQGQDDPNLNSVAGNNSARESALGFCAGLPCVRLE